MSQARVCVGEATVEAHLTWRVHAKRDPALRRLLRALYQHRREILAHYPAVPIADETEIAAIILLWERWESLRGRCPECGSDVLGVGLGGLLSIGVVTGCCLGCARLLSHDIGGAPSIQSAVTDWLRDTPYRLTLMSRPTPPSSGQLAYGGWGWGLSAALPELTAVLEELGAFDSDAAPPPSR